MEAAAGFEPAHNGFAVRSLNHLGTPPCLERTHTYTMCRTPDCVSHRVPAQIFVSQPRSAVACAPRAPRPRNSLGRPSTH
jgi:hypothetical protein